LIYIPVPVNGIDRKININDYSLKQLGQQYTGEIIRFLGLLHRNQIMATMKT